MEEPGQPPDAFLYKFCELTSPLTKCWPWIISNYLLASNIDKCIPRHYVCDGVADCPQGVDENEASCGAPCPNAWLKCSYGGCQPPSHLCDGASHCPGRDEETDLACGWRKALEIAAKQHPYTDCQNSEDINILNHPYCLPNQTVVQKMLKLRGLALTTRPVFHALER